MIIRLEPKLEEVYQHMKPYMNRTESVPELVAMCQHCERWTGCNHNYEKCRDMPCFKNWLGYAYLEWTTGCE